MVQLLAAAANAAPATVSLAGVAPSRPMPATAWTASEASRGTDQREDDVRRHPARTEVGDAQHDRERGAGVDAEDAGVGERVAGQALHARAGQPERHPDE